MLGDSATELASGSRATLACRSRGRSLPSDGGRGSPFRSVAQEPVGGVSSFGLTIIRSRGVGQARLADYGEGKEHAAAGFLTNTTDEAYFQRLRGIEEAQATRNPGEPITIW